MSTLVLGSSLKDFFKLLLDDATSRQKLTLNEFTEQYLANLLAEFAASENLFGQNEEGKRDHEPLAVLYHRALQEEREQRIRTLRRLGDVSLYKAGFFSDALRDTPVGPDYYIQMGGNAYGQVASLAGRSGFSAVYQELHDKFRALVDVLEEIAARGLVAGGAVGTLKVYETWTRTRNGRLEKVLVDAGMLTPKNGMAN